MKQLLTAALALSMMLCACSRSDQPSVDGAAMVWPEASFMPQPDPGVALLPCVLVGTIGLEGSLGQEDDTAPAHNGPDVGNGLAADAASDAPADLPAQVSLRNDTETFNRRYQFVLRDGKVWFKSNTAVTGIRQPWAAVTMPACLAGTLIGIAADDDEVIGIRADGGIYGMDNALKDYAKFNWSSRWGPVFWTGLGYKLPPGYRAVQLAVGGPSSSSARAGPLATRAIASMRNAVVNLMVLGPSFPHLARRDQLAFSSRRRAMT